MAVEKWRESFHRVASIHNLGDGGGIRGYRGLIVGIIDERRNDASEAPFAIVFQHVVVEWDTLVVEDEFAGTEGFVVLRFGHPWESRPQGASPKKTTQVEYFIPVVTQRLR